MHFQFVRALKWYPPEIITDFIIRADKIIFHVSSLTQLTNSDIYLIMRRKFTQSEINSIINLYNNGKQQWEIARQINCAQTSVSNILKRQGIKTRIGKKIIYTDVNTSFFQSIDNEISAYFLGFLYADGNISKNHNVMSLKLKSDDQYILEKFRDIMSPSSQIKITKNKNSPNEYSYFRINQKEICEQLISHGCVPNKSLILEFPTAVSNDLIRHFLRGYSDGDGTIYKNKFKNKKTINTIWKIVSTKQFCNQVAQILKEQLDVNCSRQLSNPEKNKITTTLSVGGNLQVRKVLDWLYQDATIYLSRKHDKYLKFINQISSSKSISAGISGSETSNSSVISAFNKS